MRSLVRGTAAGIGTTTLLICHHLVRANDLHFAVQYCTILHRFSLETLGDQQLITVIKTWKMASWFCVPIHYCCTLLILFTSFCYVMLCYVVDNVMLCMLYG